MGEKSPAAPVAPEKVNAVFAGGGRFREAFTLMGFSIQPHVAHLNLIPARTMSETHSHRTFECSLSLGGHMEYALGGRGVDIFPGDAIVIPAGMSHSWHAHEESRIFSMMLFISRSGEGARDDMNSLRGAVVRRDYRIPRFTEFERKAGEIFAEALGLKAGFDDKILCLTREIYVEIFRALLPERGGGSGQTRLPPQRGDKAESIMELVRYYVQDNLARPIKLAEISSHLGISVNHLCRVFKARAGMTIQEHFTARRMELGRELLLETDRMVKDIAAAVGYEDVNYFCRVFKGHFGLTPSECRRGQ